MSKSIPFTKIYYSLNFVSKVAFYRNPSSKLSNSKNIWSHDILDPNKKAE